MMPQQIDLAGPDVARLRAAARAVLEANDRGSYTVPTSDLYPHQWNWDSCLSALGWQEIDDDRAWREVETLVSHQWSGGMLPHIVFHEHHDGYFPGPDVWETARSTSTPTATSGITQPPVLGLVLEELWQRSDLSAATARRCRALVEATDRWHRWFHRWRDPMGSGLVAIVHPWESGRDNSCDWDQALSAVRVDGLMPYRRRDTTHVDPGQRPTSADYDRYLALLIGFRQLGWDPSSVHDRSPFRLVDPGFNAMLIRSDLAIARLASDLGDAPTSRAADRRALVGAAALETLWSPRHGQYVCCDLTNGALVDSASVGGLLPVLAPVGDNRLDALCHRIEDSLDRVPFGVASQDPTDPRFDPARYWRGPAWLIIDVLLAKGLREAGRHATAERVTNAALASVLVSGCAEYHDPRTGAGLGGRSFSWTAAMAIELLRGLD